MAENSAIEWCDHTFNPWIGCTRVSPACDHCYAACSTPARTLGIEWGPHAERHRTAPSTWAKPIAWNARAAEFQAQHGRRQRVFCASLADVFDNQVPASWRVDLFDLIDSTPHLDWLLLTKRIGNAAKMLDEVSNELALRETGAPWPPRPNVWLGATVATQAEADRDIPKLLGVPAAVRFLSIEPMLGPINLLATGDTLCRCDGCLSMAKQYPNDAGLQRIDWVICGGESGPGARPMHPKWARDLRDQCASAGVPFLFKQWGEWADEWHVHLDQPIPSRLRRTVSRLAVNGSVYPVHGPGPENYTGIYRVGKMAAGRLLDGVLHDAYPTVRHG